MVILELNYRLPELMLANKVLKIILETSISSSSLKDITKEVHRSEIR